jgi:hypothetical protein
MDKVSYIGSDCNLHSYIYISRTDNAIQVAIMRKEILILETVTREGREVLLNHFKECIEFSGSGQSQNTVLWI